MLGMKMATGVLGAMAAPLFGVVWAIATFVVKLLGQVVGGVWKLLRGVGAILLDHAGGIVMTTVVLALLLVAGLALHGKISGWKVEYDARMAATQEERAYEAAREAANDAAEDLEIAERVRAILGGSEARVLAVNGIGFEMRKDGHDKVVIVIGGVEAFIQTGKEEPHVYRGLGSWEYMLDSAEHWVKQSEVDAKFGGLPEDCHE